MRRRYVHVTAVLLCCVVVCGVRLQPSFGLVVNDFGLSGDDLIYNSAPIGDADPGWGNVGKLKYGTGIYLGDGWVLTANHVWWLDHRPAGSGYSYLKLEQDGVEHQYDEILGTAQRVQSDSGVDTDLMMFRINGNPDLDVIEFRQDRDPVGELATIISAGRYRSGAERDFVADGQTYSGFDITPYTRLKQWGTNVIDQRGAMLWSTETIRSTFDTGNVSEACVVDRDSGGAVFTDVGGVWKLTGVMLAVAGQDQALEDADYNAINHAIYGNSAYYANLATYYTQISDIRQIRLPGDATDDGAVDFADVYMLNATFGQTGAELPADFNNDHMVDLEDYAILRTNYGKVSGSGTGSLGSVELAPMPVAAPEPATILVLLGAAPLLFKSRKRRVKA